MSLAADVSRHANVPVRRDRCPGPGPGPGIVRTVAGIRAVGAADRGATSGRSRPAPNTGIGAPSRRRRHSACPDTPQRCETAHLHQMQQTIHNRQPPVTPHRVSPGGRGYYFVQTGLCKSRQVRAGFDLMTAHLRTTEHNPNPDVPVSLCATGNSMLGVASAPAAATAVTAVAVGMHPGLSSACALQGPAGHALVAAPASRPPAVGSRLTRYGGTWIVARRNCAGTWWRQIAWACPPFRTDDLHAHQPLRRPHATTRCEQSPVAERMRRGYLVPAARERFSLRLGGRREVQSRTHRTLVSQRRVLQSGVADRAPRESPCGSRVNAG